jgi:hypothetical protein
MQLVASQRPLDTNLSGSAFSVNIGVKLFDVLSDRLYSDKLGAVVREYACNCLDIHKRIGQTRPFIVSLPTRIDPALSFRDFGTGLNAAQVSNYFCTYFASDKNDDDSEVGGFGLGCKVGFAVADEFLVISFQGGEKTIYSCFKSAEGVPQLAHVLTVPTDEDDGLEVKIAIAEDVRDKVQDILRWFPQGSYEVLGMDVLPVKRTVETDDYMMIDKSYYHYVLMGPVAYRVDWQKIGVTPPTNLVPIFKVGDLDLPPSREYLSYDARTIEALRTKYQSIAATICAETHRKSMSLTPLERLELRQSLEPLRQVFKEYLRIKKLKHPDKWGDFLLRHHENLIVPAPTAYYERGHRGQVKSTPERGSELYLRSPDRLRNAVLIFKDCTPVYPRLRKPCIVVSPSDTVTCLDDLKRLAPGAAEYLNLSELAYTSQIRTSETMVYLRRRYYFEKVSCVVPEGSVYVPFIKTTRDYDYDIDSPLLADVPIYGLTKTAYHKLRDLNLIRVDHYLKQKQAEAAADPNLQKAVSANTILAELRASRLWDLRGAFPDLEAIVTQLVADSKLVAVDPTLKVKIKDLYGARKLLARITKRNPALLYFQKHGFRPNNMEELKASIR